MRTLLVAPLSLPGGAWLVQLCDACILHAMWGLFPLCCCWWQFGPGGEAPMIVAYLTLALYYINIIHHLPIPHALAKYVCMYVAKENKKI